MAPITKYIAFFSLALSAAALTSPHISRNVHHHAHRGLAHVAVEAETPAALVPAASSRNRRRSLNKRCSMLPPHRMFLRRRLLQTTPTPTPTPTTSSAAPAQTGSSSSNSGEPSYMIGTQSGQGTYYETGLGACGITNNDSQYIAAASELLFDSYPGYDGVNPNDNPLCNKMVTASYGGKSVQVAITDRCTACAITDLDFSPCCIPGTR
ncbi:hypothetical protein BU15DRAFT_60158 [Melanogaster broomeanus]|nr:hypothetical protein BU15DRAFT_60158 [Melanogaster broomeanus]